MKLLSIINLSLLSITWLTVSCSHIHPADVHAHLPLPDSSAFQARNEAESISQAQSYLRLGQAYQQQEQISQAIDAYLHALKSVPVEDSLVETICNRLGDCCCREDSLTCIDHQNRMTALEESHALEMHKQALTAKHQQNIACLIICSLLTFLFVLFLFLYFTNRSKKRYIKLQQLLLKNQADKMQQKNEYKQLLHTRQYIERENHEMQDKLFELWKQTVQISVRLFQTTASYRKLILMETAKMKRDREKTNEEVTGIHKEIDEVFVNALQELSEMSLGLTTDDLHFCILNYLNLSTTTIKICMRVESTQALSQRKYRIKKQLSPQAFAFIFGLSADNK